MSRSLSSGGSDPMESMQLTSTATAAELCHCKAGLVMRVGVAAAVQLRGRAHKGQQLPAACCARLAAALSRLVETCDVDNVTLTMLDAT